MCSSKIGLGHGMGTEWEQKDWQHLILADLNQLQSHYLALQGDLQIIWKSPRPFSSAAIIQVDQGLFFIKRSHRSFRSAQDLIQEHAFIAHLHQKGIAVPQVLLAKNGQSAIEIGDWSYEVHAKAKGIDLYAEQQSWKPFFFESHAFKSGELLAKMHLAAADYATAHGRTAQYLVSNQHLLESENIVDAIQTRIKQRPVLQQYFFNKTLDKNLAEQLTQFHSAIVTQLRLQSKIWTHNDLHASNLVWSTEDEHADITAVIDFGLSDLNCIAYDVAIAIERNFIDWLTLAEKDVITIDEAGLKAFLHGYVLQQQERDPLRLVPKLLPIVHVDFALSELEYFAGITGNLKHADAAYFDWLIGHTRWFSGKQGREFIAQLSTWIEESVQHD